MCRAGQLIHTEKLGVKVLKNTPEGSECFGIGESEVVGRWIMQDFEFNMRYLDFTLSRRIIELLGPVF